jgi:hypothetical protein
MCVKFGTEIIDKHAYRSDMMHYCMLSYKYDSTKHYAQK